jgi:hypothetical protein
VRIGRILALLAAILLLAFAVLKESREPFLWLFADDLLHPKPAAITRSLSEGMEVLLYSDTRPHTGKVARLQKGLVLVVDGGERIEEGYGFGLPIVDVQGWHYLSRSARVEEAGDTLVKHYEMDTMDTPSGFLRRKYEPVESIGTVTVSYTVEAGSIDMEVDFGGMGVPWERAYMMNEQGARAFTRYEEPGFAAEGEALGIWQPTDSRDGCIVAADRSLRFCVETAQSVPRYYGRERYNQYYWVGIYSLSWAGIDLVLGPSDSPFAYRVLVERRDRE